MATVKSTPVTNISTESYEPFMVKDEQAGEVHWLRTESGGEGVLYAGLWRCEPRDIPYVFPGDETFQVLEGEVHIQLEGGEAVDLGVGDIASFTKGQVATWTVKSPFKKFFVISG
jgi:uncharacterized cupin superfamily protein